MHEDIERVLIDRHAIARRLDELAAEIAEHLGPPDAAHPSGEVTLVPILTGSIIFVSDLIRRLPHRMQIHVMSVSSYPGTATSSRGASVEAALTKVPDSLRGRHVLVVDDILDSGGTLRLVRQELESRGPDSLQTCVLLRKQRPEAMATPATNCSILGRIRALLLSASLDADCRRILTQSQHPCVNSGRSSGASDRMQWRSEGGGAPR